MTTISIEDSKIKILTNHRPQCNVSGQGVIRIGRKEYNDLVKLSETTGMSITSLATQFIRFAISKSIVINAEDNSPIELWDEDSY